MHEQRVLQRTDDDRAGGLMRAQGRMRACCGAIFVHDGAAGAAVEWAVYGARLPLVPLGKMFKAGSAVLCDRGRNDRCRPSRRS